MQAWVALSFLAFAALGCDARPREAAGRAGAGSGLPQSGARVERVGEVGLYRIAIAPENGAIPLNAIHSWVVEVATAAGEPFVPTRLALDGGMPQHGHGLPTAPRVTRSLGTGRFLVEGVKFHMGGDWTLRVEVVGPPGADVAVFHVRVDG
ncbi:MAG TPA: auxin-binding protein [Myxococcota bacterium]|nr:auxin-binding protein [Myxococcota bacterium]